MQDRPAAVRAVSAALALLLVLVGCLGGDRAPGDGRLDGERLEVLATWSGAEQQRFGRVLAEFSRRTGATVTYTSARHHLPTELAARIAARRAPDVAFLPQPGLLRELAAAGRLVALDATTRQQVAEHFAPAFGELGSFDGQLFGVWFKAANKSLIWYDVAAFERAGVVPPRDLTGLLLLARRLSATGLPAFAVSARDGWTLTDWFENLYLRLAGPAAYDELAAHRIPWTHPSVVRTLRLLSQVLAPTHLPSGSLSTGFEASVVQVFGRRPLASMVAEGDFVAGAITGLTTAQLGVDADVFPFPAGPAGTPAVVGGGDVAVLLRPSRAGAALLQFLTAPEAAAFWAAAGGFISPNVDLDLSAYPDDLSRAVARQLLEAGADFRFDLSDLQPAAFGGSEEAGLAAGLRSFLVHRDVARTCAQLETAARAAYAGPS